MTSTPKVLFALLLLTLPLRADDWPMHRGDPGLSGLAKSALPDAPKLLWQYDSGDAIKASVVVSDGIAVVGNDAGQIHAIGARTGRKIWIYETGDMIESTACILNGVIYIGCGDGFLYALDLNTGKLRWKFETMGEILAAPGWATIDGKTAILIGSYDFFLYALNADTGKLIWKYETDNSINGSPGIADGKYILFGGCDELLHVVNVKDGSGHAKVPVGSNVAGSVGTRGSMVYLGHYGSQVVAVDAEAGKLKWTYQKRDFPYFAAPAVSEKLILIGGRDKRMHCLDRATGEQLWEFRAKGRIDSSAVIAGDKAVFGSDDGYLYMLSTADGKELWKFEIGMEILSSPAVVDGKILIGSLDGSVYCFGDDASGK